MGFGKQLKMVLEEIDMSVTKLSKLTHIPASTIYSIIDRDTDSVGLEKVKKIEKAVNAVPGGGIYNLLYGTWPEEAIISTRQQDFYAIGNENREWLLMEKYNSLNIKGQVKIVEYAEDLAKIPEYQNKDE